MHGLCEMIMHRVINFLPFFKWCLIKSLNKYSIAGTINEERFAGLNFRVFFVVSRVP